MPAVSADRHHVLKLVNSSGNLVRVLDKFFNGQYEQTINETPLLEFSYPIDEGLTSSFVRDNEVWLYDDSDTLMEKFRILERNDTRSSNGAVFNRVTCEGYLGKLAEETVLDYTASPTNAFTITEIVEDLLDLQVGSSPITYNAGKIDSAIGDPVRSLVVTSKSILDTLRELRETIGGYFYVDSGGDFNWVSNLGDNIGKEVRFKKNLVSIEKRLDYKDLVTRLHAFGSGEDEDVLVRLAPCVKLENLSRYWPFNGTPNELMDSGNDAEVPGTATTPTYTSKGGNVGGDSSTHDGTLDMWWVTGTSMIGLASTVTVCGWIKVDTAPSEGNYMNMYAEAAIGDMLHGLGVKTVSGNMKASIVYDDDSDVQQAELTGTTTLSTGTWYHLALVDDGSNLKLYVNGTQEDSTTAYTGTFTPTRSCFGGARQSGSYINMLDGQIDDIRVYNTELTSAELTVMATAANNYMESGVATYGTVVRAVADRSVTHPDTLFQYAKKYIQDRDEPIVKYDVKATDIRKANRTLEGGDTFDDSFEDIDIGDTVRVVDEDLSVSDSQVIVAKTTNLDNPLDVRLEIKNQTDLFTDPSEVFSLGDLTSHQAVTQIGAGNVIVQGSFTVLNWTDGTNTTIDGGNITAGTVTADRLDVDQLDAVSANMGEVVLQADGAGDGAVRSSDATGFEQGTGLWLGTESGTGKFYFGNIADSDFILNGDFASDISLWSYGGNHTVTYSSGKMRVQNAEDADWIAQVPADNPALNNMITGETYTITGTISSSSGMSASKNIRYRLGGTGGTDSDPIYGDGPFSVTAVCGNQNKNFNQYATVSSGSMDYRIDDVTCTGPTGNYVSWDGTLLKINGDLNAERATIGVLNTNNLPLESHPDINTNYIGITDTGNSLVTETLFQGSLKIGWNAPNGFNWEFFGNVGSNAIANTGVLEYTYLEGSGTLNLRISQQPPGQSSTVIQDTSFTGSGTKTISSLPVSVSGNHRFYFSVTGPAPGGSTFEGYHITKVIWKYQNTVQSTEFGVI